MTDCSPLVAVFAVLSACAPKPSVSAEIIDDFERELETVLAANAINVELDNYARYYSGHEMGKGPQLSGPEWVRGVFISGTLAERTGVFVDVRPKYPAIEDESGEDGCKWRFSAAYDVRERQVVLIDECGEVTLNDEVSP